MTTLHIDTIIARLQTLVDAGTISSVAGLGDISDAPENTLTSDSVFVFPPSKAGGQNNAGTMRVNQPVTVQIGTAIVFKGIGSGGAQMTTHMQDVCDGVEAELFGWSPGEGLSPLTLVTARMEHVSTATGTMVYSFIFQTTTQARKA
jgi:hypothetical protein